MKKMIVFLFGLFLSGAALACNMDRNDCSGLMLPELQRYADELSNNKAWKTNADPKDVAKIKRYGERLNNCSDYRCSNQVLFYYTNEMRGLAGKYRQAATPAKTVSVDNTNDPWMDQCVMGKKSETQVYLDKHRLSMFGGREILNIVTQASNDMVSFMDEKTGRRIWVMKTDLEMLAYRNCS